MKKKVKFFITLSFIFLSFITICEAKPKPITHHGKLTLQNEPKIGQIAIIKVIKTGGYDDTDAELGCFFPERLEFINDKGYKVTYVEPPLSLEKGLRVIFYSGPFKKREIKEALFKVRIPDDKKYTIVGGGPYDPEGKLEIDLGDPEPPEWLPQDMELVGEKEGRPHIKSSIKQLEGKGLIDLTIPEDSLPPLRTELKIRTKDRPHLYLSNVIAKTPGTVTIIPISYLVYTEEETPNLKATLTLPKGLRFIRGDKTHKIYSLRDGRQKVLLYSGQMRFKQCKAFYLKVKVVTQKQEYPIEATAEITTIDDKKLLKEDKLVLDLMPRHL